MRKSTVSRVLNVWQWKEDRRKGYVLVRFSMRFTDPISGKSKYAYLSENDSKGWYRTKATPSGKKRNGEPKLLLTDIKNLQIINKVKEELDKKVDFIVAGLTGELLEKEVRKNLTLGEIAKPFDENGEPYGMAFLWWLNKRLPAKNTIVTRVAVYNQYVKPYFSESINLAQLLMQLPKIQNIINRANMGTAKNIAIYYKMIFDWALENEEITVVQHPFISKKLHYKRLTRSEKQAMKRADLAEKYLEPEEARQVIEIIDEWDTRPNNKIFADVLRIMYLTGLRPSETLGLNEDVLDFENKQIKVHWQRISHNRTDQEMKALRLPEKERYRSDLKTDESIRTIVMSPKVEEILKKHIKENQFHVAHNPSYQDLGYIFTRKNIRSGNLQGSPFYHMELSMFLRGGTSQSAKYNKKSGKPYPDIDDLVDFGRPIHILPHMFRHSFISHLASSGVPINVIREIVGHSGNSKEIENIYLHLTNKMRKKADLAIQKLDDFL